MNQLQTTNKALKKSEIEQIFMVDSKLSVLTVRGYSAASIEFFEHIRVLGLPGIRAVNSSIITNYKRTLIEKGLKNATINFKLKAVRAFYRQLVKAGRIEANPTDGLEYEKEAGFTAEYKALTKKQIEVLFHKLKKDQTERGRQRYALILLLTLSGLRASEACNLQFKDLLFEGNKSGLSYSDVKSQKLTVLALCVRHGKGNRERMVEMRQPVLDAVLAYREAAGIEGEYLFYTIPQNRIQARTQLNRFNLFYTVRKICRDILKIDVHPHTFRHTYATVSLELGADLFSISKVLGHASVDMTSRYLQRHESVLNYWQGIMPVAS